MIEVSTTSSKTGVAYETEAITPLRQRMIEDMNSRKLCALAQPRKKLRKAPEKAPEKGKETSSTEQPQA